MPIPEQKPEFRLLLTHQPTLQALEYKPVLASASAPSLSSRAYAHIVDLYILQGFSLYSSKLLALAFISFHVPAAMDHGKQAALLFQNSWDFTFGLLTLSCFLSASFLYFVALPLVAKRTLGMGIFGLKLVTHKNEAPGLADLLSRYLWCWVNYLSLGVLNFFTRNERAQLFHDKISETKIDWS